MRSGIARAAGLAVALPFTVHCNSITGPSCLSRQQRGGVTSVSGTVAAGTVVMHEVPYGTDGSQNDLSINWTNQRAAGGPRIRVYATRVECADFVPPPDYGPNRATGACANLGSMGGVLAPDARACAVAKTCAPEDSDIVQTSLTITNGRGNPDVLGPGARYKLWIVGDARQDVAYSIGITWFYGPDC
jgi:hypothetical protein